jgi:hypothetical protein
LKREFLNESGLAASKAAMPFYLTVWIFLGALAILAWVVLGDCEKSGK